jgi:two-component system chemotaxis sensor kinase CheA
VPVYRLRGKLLPLVYLGNQLRLPHDRRTPDEVNIVVLEADGRTFGLVVDEINDTEEIVVKPLSKHLNGIHAYAGATIRGDGRVALILDVFGLAQNAGVLGEHREALASALAEATSTQAGDPMTLLVFAVGSSRFAVSLGQVARLEELPRSAVERTGSAEVVQYRGGLLTLTRLGEMFGQYGEDDADPLQVLVVRQASGYVGLVVDRILDIVEERVVVYRRRGGDGMGVAGTAVVQGQVTDIVDVEQLLSMRDINPFEAPAA